MPAYRNGIEQAAYRNGIKQVGYRNGVKVLGLAQTHILNCQRVDDDTIGMVYFSAGSINPIMLDKPSGGSEVIITLYTRGDVLQFTQISLNQEVSLTKIRITRLDTFFSRDLVKTVEDGKKYQIDQPMFYEADIGQSIPLSILFIA